MTTPARPPTVLAASSAYFTARGLSILAGLISMPITTRFLSKEEYGLLSLTFAMVSVLAIVGALGFGEATLRFYGEQRARGAAALRNLCSNMFGGALMVSSVVAVMTFACAYRCVPGGQPHAARVLHAASILVVIRVVSATVFQMYRAAERAVAHAVGHVIVTYGTLVLVIGLFLFSERSAFVVICATIIVEGAILLVVLWDLAARGVIALPQFRRPILSAATAYGVPLALASSARFVLDYSDRFLIERFLGLNAVADYTVAYDLVQRFGDSLSAPVAMAVLPVLFRMWVEEGRDATSRFASRVFTNLLAGAIPAAVLFGIFNQDIITLLASAKYRESAMLTPFLLPGILLGGMNFLIAAGLTLEKNTTALAFNVFVAALLNVVMNLVVIPRRGLVGAAAATTVAYGLLAVANYWRARAALALRLEYATLAKAVLATGLTSVVLVVLGHVSSQLFIDLAVRGMVGVATIAGCFWRLHPGFRRWMRWRVLQETE